MEISDHPEFERIRDRTLLKNKILSWTAMVIALCVIVLMLPILASFTKWVVFIYIGFIMVSLNYLIKSFDSMEDDISFEEAGISKLEEYDKLRLARKYAREIAKREGTKVPRVRLSFNKRRNACITHLNDYTKNIYGQPIIYINNNLVGRLTKKELRSLIAHEIAHDVNHDIVHGPQLYFWLRVLAAYLSAGLALYFIDPALFFPPYSLFNCFAYLIIFGIYLALFWVVTTCLMEIPLGHASSRFSEYSADALALRYGDARSMIGSLEKIHGYYRQTFKNYKGPAATATTHPTFKKRKTRLEKLEKKINPDS